MLPLRVLLALPRPPHVVPYLIWWLGGSRVSVAQRLGWN
jgi:hypothetical protein